MPPPALPPADPNTRAPAAGRLSTFLGDPRRHRLFVPVLLALSVLLAVTSLLNDSATFDEPFHLAAGLSYLRTGDFRLSPDHPPLARVWLAAPLLASDCAWPAADHETWVQMDNARFSVQWLFGLNGDRCQSFVLSGRFMMVVLLVATLLVIYALGRTLFGPGAGLLALALAALSPTLLAHGRLATTDLPITLCFALVLLTFARLLQRLTWLRLLAAAAALAAAALTKLSWPLMLPALGVMALVAIFRAAPIAAPAAGPRGSVAPRATTRPLVGRRERAAYLGGAALFIALFVYVSIWACYGFRRSMLAPLPADADAAVRETYQRTIDQMGVEWQIAFYRLDGSRRTGLLPTFLEYCVEHSLLPDAYLFGLARTMFFTGARYAYLMGAYSDTGWRSYFPIAFAIKTPLATQLLLLAGVVALVLRRRPPRDAALLAGLVVFTLLYAAFVIRASVNIGHRHLLPVYPAVFILAGAAVAWTAARHGRWLIGGAVAWLLAANLWVHPHYLAYYNELIGGPSRGYRYLLDSSTDWGQDLLRLARYAPAHTEEPVKLAYFGSALPTAYLDCGSVASHGEFEPRAPLTAGLYVVSVTQLMGVYDPEIRDTFWTPEHRRGYAVLAQMAAARPPADAPPEEHEQYAEACREYDDLRRKRLINQLQERAPDDRVGYSLLVFNLSAADLAALTRP